MKRRNISSVFGVEEQFLAQRQLRRVLEPFFRVWRKGFDKQFDLKFNDYINRVDTRVARAPAGELEYLLNWRNRKIQQMEISIRAATVGAEVVLLYLRLNRALGSTEPLEKATHMGSKRWLTLLAQASQDPSFADPSICLSLLRGQEHPGQAEQSIRSAPLPGELDRVLQRLVGLYVHGVISDHLQSKPSPGSSQQSDPSYHVAFAVSLITHLTTLDPSFIPNTTDAGDRRLSVNSDTLQGKHPPSPCPELSDPLLLPQDQDAALPASLNRDLRALNHSPQSQTGTRERVASLSHSSTLKDLEDKAARVAPQMPDFTFLTQLDRSAEVSSKPRLKSRKGKAKRVQRNDSGDGSGPWAHVLNESSDLDSHYSLSLGLDDDEAASARKDRVKPQAKEVGRKDSSLNRGKRDTQLNHTAKLPPTSEPEAAQAGDLVAAKGQDSEASYGSEPSDEGPRSGVTPNQLTELRPGIRSSTHQNGLLSSPSRSPPAKHSDPARSLLASATTGSTTGQTAMEMESSPLVFKKMSQLGLFVFPLQEVWKSHRNQSHQSQSPAIAITSSSRDSPSTESSLVLTQEETDSVKIMLAEPNHVRSEQPNGTLKLLEPPEPSENSHSMVSKPSDADTTDLNRALTRPPVSKLSLSTTTDADSGSTNMLSRSDKIARLRSSLEHINTGTIRVLGGAAEKHQVVGYQPHSDKHTHEAMVQIVQQHYRTGPSPSVGEATVPSRPYNPTSSPPLSLDPALQKLKLKLNIGRYKHREASGQHQLRMGITSLAAPMNENPALGLSCALNQRHIHQSHQSIPVSVPPIGSYGHTGQAPADSAPVEQNELKPQSEFHSAIRSSSHHRSAPSTFRSSSVQQRVLSHSASNKHLRKTKTKTKRSKAHKVRPTTSTGDSRSAMVYNSPTKSRSLRPSTSGDLRPSRHGSYRQAFSQAHAQGRSRNEGAFRTNPGRRPTSPLWRPRSQFGLRSRVSPNSHIGLTPRSAPTEDKQQNREVKQAKANPLRLYASESRVPARARAHQNSGVLMVDSKSTKPLLVGAGPQQNQQKHDNKQAAIGMHIPPLRFDTTDDVGEGSDREAGLITAEMDRALSQRPHLSKRGQGVGSPVLPSNNELLAWTALSTGREREMDVSDSADSSAEHSSNAHTDPLSFTNAMSRSSEVTFSSGNRQLMGKEIPHGWSPGSTGRTHSHYSFGRNNLGSDQSPKSHTHTSHHAELIGGWRPVRPQVLELSLSPERLVKTTSGITHSSLTHDHTQQEYHHDTFNDLSDTSTQVRFIKKPTPEPFKAVVVGTRRTINSPFKQSRKNMVSN